MFENFNCLQSKNNNAGNYLILQIEQLVLAVI